MAIISRRAPPVAHDAPDAIGALRLAHALIENVREAATPAREEHVGRKRQLDLLALAAKQLAIAHKHDPDAILEGQDQSGQPTASASTS